MELSDNDSSLSDDFDQPSKKSKKSDEKEHPKPEDSASSLSDDFDQPSKKSKKSDEKEHSKPEDSAKKTVKKKLYQCQYCPSTFSVKSNCTRHTKVCSFNTEKNSNAYVCEKCNACFNRKDNLSSHLKKCSVSEKAPPRKKPCLIEGCDLEFVHHIGLIEHMRSSHQNEVVIKPMVSKTFTSISEFNDWKEKEETDTFSYFTKRRGTPAAGNQHFYCQHDGSGKLHSSRKSSRRNLKGRVKVGHHCIAKMIARVDPETKVVNVEYHPTHSHLCKSEDFLHHPLPDAMSRFIDKRLAENIPPCVVYELTKTQFLPKNDSSSINPRANILTKKRILERGRRRRMARRLHKDDAKAVFLMVKQLVESDDCILLYKPYGTGVEYGPEEINQLPDSKELFMLGIQTQNQLELFKKHCGKIVILDETHGTNQYKYQLLTAMVVDENRRGWPIAHLITSKSDGNTLKYFFQCLKSRLGDDCSIGCVITDDDAALINGINDGFSENLKHILCIWHVFKNLKDALKSRASKELFDSMLDEVKLLMNIKEESVFLLLRSGFVKKYATNPDAVKFLKYFQKYYLNRSEKWAMCYRNFPHAEVNTTGHLESFHNRLKKFYLKRKVNKRLDDLTQLLLDVAWDDHCTRQREAAIGFSALPQPMWERHQRGLAMEDDAIVKHALENTWEVKSADSKKSVSYVVVQHKEICNSDFCFSRCTKPECHGLCAHLFSCSCPDHHPICKHIHKLQSFLTRGQADIAAPSDFYHFENFKDLEFVENEQNLDGNENINTTTGNNNSTTENNKKWLLMVSRMKENFSKLQEFISAAEQRNSCVAEHTLVHADAVLSDLVQSFGAMDFSCDDVNSVPEMTVAVQFAPNEKLKTQVSQLASFKRPQKKKSKSDPATLAERKKSAMESLLFCAQSSNEDHVEVDDPDNVYESFTPSLSSVIDPLEHILLCGDETLSLIDLKSLELQLPSAEEDVYLERDVVFKCGRIHSCIINAFISKLSENFNVSFLSSEFALRAANGLSNVAVLKEKMIELNEKSAILVPTNITEDQLFILAIMNGEEEIRFYDPCQRPLSQKVLQCLTQIVSDLKAVKPLTSQWKIKLVKFPGEQGDDVNCGPKICHFAQQTAEGRKDYSKLNLESQYNFRSHIYKTIVGNCLKKQFFDDTCGKCEIPYSSDQSSLVWISCCQCQQWYHEACVGNFSGRFTCP